MMITKMILCAAAIVMADAPAKDEKPQANVEQKAVQEPVEKAAQPGQPLVAQQPAPAAAKTDGKAAPVTAPEDEEKEIDGVKLQTIEANIVSYTNQERARYGLPALKVDKELMETAREHAAWMTRTRNMVHTRRAVAENIAMGQPHSSDVVRAWMNSSGHRANILNSGHLRIGVAAFRTESGTIFWCQQFQN
jgi:uncharacterized protein YkwD